MHHLCFAVGIMDVVSIDSITIVLILCYDYARVSYAQIDAHYNETSPEKVIHKYSRIKHPFT